MLQYSTAKRGVAAQNCYRETAVLAVRNNNNVNKQLEIAIGTHAQLFCVLKPYLPDGWIHDKSYWHLFIPIYTHLYLPTGVLFCFRINPCRRRHIICRARFLLGGSEAAKAQSKGLALWITPLVTPAIPAKAWSNARGCS